MAIFRKRQTEVPIVALKNLDLYEKIEITLLSQFFLPLLNFLATLLATLPSIRRSRAALGLENLALRHQIGVLQRSPRKRARLTPPDRLSWVWLFRIWSDWRSALTIIQPETMIAWHRGGFGLFWAGRFGVASREDPTLPREVRDLIRRMPRKSHLERTRIQGELLKLGIDIGGEQRE